MAESMSGLDYEKRYFPMGGFILVRKDMAPKKVGSIVMPERVRDEHSKFTCTGIVVSKSLFEVFEEDLDRYFYNAVRPGDRIGFSGTVPLYSPTPPDWQLEGDDKEVYVTLHVRDILCVICDTEEKRVEFAERFGR